MNNEIPRLPEPVNGWVDFVKGDTAYNVTRTGPDTWVVRRTHDDSYRGELTLQGSLFDFRANAGLFASGATGVSWPDVYRGML